VSFDWQHGQSTSIGGVGFLAIPVFYVKNGLKEYAMPVVSQFQVVAIHLLRAASTARTRCHPYGVLPLLV
jgi:hypothetical protein